jgi:hypothetical protein
VKNALAVKNLSSVMTKLRNLARGSRRPYTYQIILQGPLGQQWTEWFGEFSITLDPNGHTILTEPVMEQAALHGLLKKSWTQE